MRRFVVDPFLRAAFRFFRNKSLVAWILFGWSFCGILSRIEYINRRMNDFLKLVLSLWEFALTPIGSLILMALGFASIFLSRRGPNLLKNASTRFGWTIPVEPVPIELRVEALETSLQKQTDVPEKLRTNQSALQHVTERVISFPSVVMTLIILRELHVAAGDLERELRRLSNLHGHIVVPTNQAWNKWADDFALHIMACQGLAVDAGGPYFDGDLFSIGGAWANNNWSVNADSRLMLKPHKEHTDRLYRIRQHYIRRVNQTVEAKVEIVN